MFSSENEVPDFSPINTSYSDLDLCLFSLQHIRVTLFSLLHHLNSSASARTQLEKLKIFLSFSENLQPQFSFIMEMASGVVADKEEGMVSRLWDWFKALPGKIMSKVVELGKKTKKLGEDDPRRIIHSLKVGLAITLVSLFYYFEPLYDGFGVSGMWAVLTVVVFEFSVGKHLF